MKKTLLLLIAVFLAATVNAAVTLHMGNTKLEPGTTSTFNNVAYGPLDGATINPNLSLLSDTDTSFDLSIDCVTGQTLQFCGAGICKMITSTDYSGTLKAGNKWRMLLEYMDYKAQSVEQVAKDIRINLKVTAGGRTDSYTLILNSSQSGITTVKEDCNVVFSDDVLHYNVSGPTTATVCDLRGAVLVRTTVNGSGAISLAGLSQGTYIYCLGSAVGKILVK